MEPVPPPPLPSAPPPPPSHLQMQSQNPTAIANKVTHFTVQKPSLDDEHHQGQEEEPRAMVNFRALVLKIAASDPTRPPLTEAQNRLIEKRLTEFFPDLPTPDHPAYGEMIHGAISELNEEKGSSEESISNFIEKEYADLPRAHSTILKHQLGKLCDTGEIVLTCDECYLLGDCDFLGDANATTQLSPNQDAEQMHSEEQNDAGGEQTVRDGKQVEMIKSPGTMGKEKEELPCKEYDHQQQQEQENLQHMKMLIQNRSLLLERKEKVVCSHGPEPPPGLPQKFLDRICSINGSGVKLVIQKALTKCDSNRSLDRLTMPLNQLRASEFLNDEEKELLNTYDYEGKNLNGINVLVLEPNGGGCVLKFKRWKMSKQSGKSCSSSYMFIKEWWSVTQRNKLISGMVVQVWTFRQANGELCFALVNLGECGNHHRSEVH